ncbi:HET-domain-containing protein [Lepidopterella palustris CBS 459.81]|uniref:HET-domain-containing protein n=1 Tax=Lepidopterella palustris CBS 459.81 TaxID=1314670 RepID=A0A8E2EBN9_9PEZI|nr:HET-domain-containing protein [Lepidopterella palustris CBS 459.81]
MPIRVIDVISFEDHGDPRLLETRGLKGRYIAISHSWGRVVKPFTTTKNIESLKKRIDFASLPKTFQDSIFIARKLRVQYVWIDSVCIIQDDGEDWTREAKTMGLVYQKAYLAISASESPGDHAGFLTQSLQVKMGVVLPYCPADTASGYIYLRGTFTAASSHNAQL